MDRQEIIQALLQNMETIGKAMMVRSFEQPKGNLPTHSQMGVLFVLLHRGQQSIKSLADSFRMSSSAATQLVNGLVNDGLLTRVEDKQDRRKICVAITTKGKRMLELARKQRLKNMTKIFESLTNDELAQLEKIHRKVVERLQFLWTKKQHK